MYGKKLCENLAKGFVTYRESIGMYANVMRVVMSPAT